MTPTTPAVLYSDTIRERWRRPRFRGALPDATAVAEDVNPLCGDRVRMMVRLQDGSVQAARFTGDSCAICTASSDVVAELIEGRTAAEAAKLATDDVLGVLQADIRPTRMRCVTLPLTVLATALSNGERSQDHPRSEPDVERSRQPSGTGHPRNEPDVERSRQPSGTGHPRNEPDSRGPLQ